MYTAAEIADLNVLTLIEENTAAALHYGIDRVFEEPHTVLYYNMGAGSTQVTVATYSSFSSLKTPSFHICVFFMHLYFYRIEQREDKDSV